MRVPAPMKAADLTGQVRWGDQKPFAALRPHLGFGKVMELKYDGTRSSLHMRAGRSSFGETRSTSFPYWARIHVTGLEGTIIDGEFIAGTLPGEVRPPRERSSGWYGSAPRTALGYELAYGRPDRPRPGKPGPRFVAFDLPAYAGADWTRKPYTERRARLTEVIAAIDAKYPGSGIVLAEQMPASAATIERVIAAGHEGVIIKDPGSLYEPGKRTGRWAKVKATADISLVLTGGWKPGEGGWSHRVGAVELALAGDDGELIPAGYCAVKPELANAYTGPDGGLAPGLAGVVWEVRVNGLTAPLEDGGQLMHPRMMYVRHDQTRADAGLHQLAALPKTPAAPRRRPARKTA